MLRALGRTLRVREAQAARYCAVALCGGGVGGAKFCLAESKQLKKKQPKWLLEKTPRRPPYVKKMRKRKLGLFDVARRVCRWATALGPVACWAPLAYLLGGAALEAWWSHLLWAIETCGPTLTKLAQWAASRRDLFPGRACDRLGRLQTKARGHSTVDSRRALDAAFGSDWPNWLKLEESVGSGVIATVHKGRATWLPVYGHDEDDDHIERIVAVKVVHPLIREKIERDLTALSYVASGMERVAPKLLEFFDPSGAVEEFSDNLRNSISMEQEAFNLARLSANFKDRYRVTVPMPLAASDANDAGALVEEFVGGLPLQEAITALTGADGEECDLARKRLARRGLVTLLQMLFIDNFAHADMHAGNMLVRFAGDDLVRSVAADDFELVLLDAGLVVELQPEDRRNFADLFGAVVLGDGQLAGSLLLERARHHDCPNPAAFKNAVAELVDRATSQREADNCRSLTLANVRVAELLSDVLSLCYVHRVRLETRFTTTVCAIAIIEGIGRTLDPDIDLLLEAKRVLFPALSDRLTTIIYCFYSKFGKTLGLPPPAMFI